MTYMTCTKDTIYTAYTCTQIHTNTWTSITAEATFAAYSFLSSKETLFRFCFFSTSPILRFSYTTLTEYDTYNTILKICGSLLLCSFTLNVYLCNNILEEDDKATLCHWSSTVMKDTSESDVSGIVSKACSPSFGAKANAIKVS